MSTEQTASGSDIVGSAAWRSRTLALQEAALPDGSALVTCSAPYGGGGLGRHMRELLDALERSGQPRDHICEAGAGAPADAERELSVGRSLALAPLTRFSPGWRLWSASVRFDRAAARRLRPADHLLAFNGTALAQFRRARAMAGCAPVLVSATAHMGLVVEQHRRAQRQYPVERPWGARQLRRNLAEYALAERILVSSSYVLESFADRGIDRERLTLFPLTPDPRFAPAAAPAPARQDTFEVVYVGGLSVDKGVPLLLDAFSRVPGSDLRLVLVGGWRTRGMRRHVQGAIERDGRISVSPGDPLERLRSASLYVHASYSDGFAYAPAEALACGVPVLVSEDTGMKGLVAGGSDGAVLPTGDVGALSEAIDSAYRRESLGGISRA